MQRTGNVLSIRLNKPEKLFYKAGQYMFVTINNGEKPLRKHFTISSSPTEDYVEFTKKLTGSEFSDALKRLFIDDLIEIEAPYGSFTMENDVGKIGMISGGIGITPLRSMIKYFVDSKLERNISLLYSNRTEHDIIFKGEFDELMEQCKNLNIVYTLTSPVPGWKGERGRIDEDMINRVFPDYRERLFYTCGSSSMVDSMRHLLARLGLPKERIRFEYFPGY